MKILRATHLGMCFGVRDAIALAQSASARQPLTILGDLVHNETVLADLRQRGVRIEHTVEAVTTPSVMITAHGTSEATLAQVRARGLEVQEATCPLVHFAHRALRQLVAAGYHPVVIGQRAHVEVRGMTDDLTEYDVILTPDDVANLAERPRYGLVSQTTQPIAKVRELVGLVRQRFPHADVRFTDTVCQPTKQRQAAAEDLAQRCDAVVVVGGAHSNNTRELVQTCARHCRQVHHVQTADDVQVEWLAGVETVGITAGTSTPDSLIAAVEKRVELLGAFYAAAVTSFALMEA